MFYFQWSIPVPKCLTPCIIPQVEKGVASEPVGEKVTHGDEITVNCTDNYEVKFILLLAFGKNDSRVCNNLGYGQTSLLHF